MTYNLIILYTFTTVVAITILSGFLVKFYRNKQLKKTATKPQETKRVNIELKGDIFELNKLAVILEDLVRYDVPIETIFELNIIIEEVFSSIINHQKEDSPDNKIHINLIINSGLVTVFIKDYNDEFNPTLIPKIDINAPLEEISFQGLGFHLVRHYADNLTYKRQNDMNILTIKKSFAAL
jgi:anti-sigma regulatory factor (Ser/Thr protein kinase)